MDTATSALVITAAMLFSLCLAVLAEEFFTGTLFRFVFHRRPAAVRADTGENGPGRACFGPNHRLN